MDLLCPECRSRLVWIAEDKLRCPAHAQVLDVLFAGSSVRRRSAGPVTGSTGQMCVAHPGVAAVEHCSRCDAAICATCDFLFPGGLHLCPTCATTPPAGVAGKRTKLAIGSLLLAIWGMLGTIAMIVLTSAEGNDPREAEGIGMIFGMVVLLPTVIGLALGISSFERNTRNSPLSWIGTIANGLLVILWIMMILLGSLVELAG